MPYSDPKLRVIEEKPSEPAVLVRLGSRGATVEPVRRLPGPRAMEDTEVLACEGRKNFEGRSIEPGEDLILEPREQHANVEHPWGMQDGRIIGVPYGWFVLIFLVLAGAGAWSFLAMRRGEMKLEVHHGSVRRLVADEQDETRAATELVERVERAVAAYLQADTIEEILPWIRHPERVRPMIEEAWKDEPKRPLKFLRMTQFQPAILDTKPFWAVSAEVDGGEAQSLLVEQIGETGAKIDWETHVCHQPMRWDRYLAERPTDGTFDFRVWAERDAHFSHEFSDASRWKCFRLMARESEGHLFGYAPAGSGVAEELDALCRKSPEGRASVLLRLRVPQDTVSPAGAVIERIVAPRWVLLSAGQTDAP